MSEQKNASVPKHNNFTEDEVRQAIFQMEHNKALDLDGFPTKFYQVYWKVIKDKLMNLFSDFHQGKLAIYNLNFGVITLIPKKRKR